MKCSISSISCCLCTYCLWLVFNVVVSSTSTDFYQRHTKFDSSSSLMIASETGSGSFMHLPNLDQESHTIHPIKSTEQSTGSNSDGSEAIQSSGYSSTNIQSIMYSRQRRQSPDGDQSDKCRLFSETESGKNELYSPDYPNNYPKNINCTRIITAPKGQIIRLDFRNSFHIEAKEECKFDFLEVRDGQYGFSKLIGRYCGTDFPPEITSKERYLWLHFHSDESIEYSGFTAVYRFIDRSREAPSTDLNCTIDKDGYEGFVNSTDVPQDIRDTVVRNKIPLDCMWRIQVLDNWKIQVKFLDFKLSKPNDCESNFLDIFPEQTLMPFRVKNFCGSAGEGITSESNILHMRFYAEQLAINSTFAILFTAFRDRGVGACTDDEYDCEDATCISNELKCNGRDNCKFRWDEEGCATEAGGQSEHVVIIIIVFGLILGGMVITFLINCIRKIIRDQKIIREHIRQSRESKINEMGRHSKSRQSQQTLADFSTKQKYSDPSLKGLPNATSEFYRQPHTAPIPREGSKTDVPDQENSILRYRHDMVAQTSFSSNEKDSMSNNEIAASKYNVNNCDMACQTRESLFDPVFLAQKPSRSGSSHVYTDDIIPPPSHSTYSPRTIKGPHHRSNEVILHLENPVQPSGEVCHHHSSHHHGRGTHQQHDIHHADKPAHMNTTLPITIESKKKLKPKQDESKISIDNRKSAPDVIIMTSH